MIFPEAPAPAVMKRRFSFSGILSFLFFAGLLLVFYNWSSFVDANGQAGAASVTEKRETVRENFGDWFRQFQIFAAFRVPVSPLEHRAVCDVEQATYDSLRVGAPVTIHYFPSMLQQPFIPVTHLSPCTPLAAFGSNPDLYRKVALVFGSLLLIFFAFLVLRLRVALWLLVPWFGLFIVDCVTPHAEPAPGQPRFARATVKGIANIDEILADTTGGEHSATPLKLDHPYQLVQLEFTPPGAAGPVVALDAIDRNSLPGLELNRAVDVDYDAANPRIARLRGGNPQFSPAGAASINVALRRPGSALDRVLALRSLTEAVKARMAPRQVAELMIPSWAARAAYAPQPCPTPP